MTAALKLECLRLALSQGFNLGTDATEQALREATNKFYAIVTEGVNVEPGAAGIDHLDGEPVTVVAGGEHSGQPDQALEKSKPAGSGATGKAGPKKRRR